MNKRKHQGTIDNSQAEHARLPLLCGADIELGNFVLDLNRRDRDRNSSSTGDEASQALLREIEGLPRVERLRQAECGCAMCRGLNSSRSNNTGEAIIKGAIQGGGRKMGGRGGFNPQDWGRKFLPGNGGCAYIDLDHLELCLPEVVSAYDHVACWHAMLRIARDAMQKANERLPDGRKIQVLVNNTDGRGNSYGSHLDFLLTRRTWNNLFLRKMHYMLYLASFQVSSIVVTGQGKVGSENGAEPAAFQISQRADFFETLAGVQTTYNRPIVNSRDEPLCGRRKFVEMDESEAAQMARLHVIFFDNTLSHVASLLKVGVMQIVLAMIEAECVSAELILDDPVEIVGRWSRDPTLKTRARLVSGREVTAVELQLLFLEEAKEFVACGGCNSVVPRAEEILSLWEDTLLKLQAGDFAALASRLDWVLKLSVLQQVIGKSGLNWDAPQIKHLDHMYSSLDSSEGIYWAYEASGFVERVVSADEIERFVYEPPVDTRAWTRATLLRLVEPEAVDDVNWDFIRFKYRDENSRTITRTLDLASPLAFTRIETERIFQESGSLGQLLDALGAPPEDKASGKTRAFPARNNGESQSWKTLFGLPQLTAWDDEPSPDINPDAQSLAEDEPAVEDFDEQWPADLEDED
jgi:proteasome accessory factor A